MIILLLLLKYGTPNSPAREYRMLLALILGGGMSIFLFTPTLCLSSFLALLQASTIPLSLLSKVPQMLELQKRKAPGQLSAVVVFAQFAGTIARIFTSLTETQDALLLWGFGLAAIFNAIILAQLVLYWNGNVKEQKRKAE